MRTAHIELHTAVLLFGIAGLFGKLVEASPVIIVLGRTAFAAVVIFLGLKIFRISVKAGSYRALALLLLSGVLLAIHWWTFFHAIQISTVAVGLVGYATFPIFVTFLEPLISSQKLRLVDFVSATLVLFGLVLVAPAFTLADQGLVGLLWAVLSGLLFAVFTLMNRQLVVRHSTMVVVYYQQFVAALCLLPFALNEGVIPGNNTVALLLILGVICTALPHSLFIKSLSVLKAQLASVVAALEPVYGIILAIIFLNEVPDFSTALGAGIVLGAVVLAIKAHTVPAVTGPSESDNQ